MDWASLGAHMRAVRTVSRARVGPHPVGTAIVVDDEQVRSFRLRAMHLADRLPGGSLVEASHGGLQDSAPRAALLALHARVEGIGPAAWEDPRLVQIWFRWADYVVPRSDLGVFTLGALPRDPARAAVLHTLADAMVSVLDGRPRRTSDVVAAIPGLPHDSLVRAAAVTGKFVIRWDARTTVVVPVDPPPVDVEAARLELARRFLGWMAPATPVQFGRWAGVAPDDAARTWDLLLPDLVPVTWRAEGRWAMAGDVDRLAETVETRGVRFLPEGDPYLSIDHDRLGPTSPRPAGWAPRLLPPDERRLLNSLTGRVLLDGMIAGAWGRARRVLTVEPWGAWTKAVRASVAESGAALAGPMGGDLDLRWLR